MTNQLLRHIEGNADIIQETYSSLVGSFAGHVLGGLASNSSPRTMEARKQWVVSKEKLDNINEILAVDPSNPKLKKEKSKASISEKKLLKIYSEVKRREGAEYKSMGSFVGGAMGSLNTLFKANRSMTDLENGISRGAMGSAANTSQADGILLGVGASKVAYLSITGAIIGNLIARIVSSLTPGTIRLRDIWKKNESKVILALDSHLSNPKDKNLTKEYADSVKSAELSKGIYLKSLSKYNVKGSLIGAGLGAAASVAMIRKFKVPYVSESVSSQVKFGAIAGSAIGGTAGIIAASFNKDVKKAYILWKNAQSISDEMLERVSENPLDKDTKKQYRMSKKNELVAKTKYIRLRRKHRAINMATSATVGAGIGAAVGDGKLNPLLDKIRKAKMGKVRTYNPPLALT